MKQYDPMPVAGYTVQSAANVALVNQSKRMEEQVLRLLDMMLDNPETDKRWVAIARTQIEQGFMSANRAVFKPKRIGGEV